MQRKPVTHPPREIPPRSLAEPRTLGLLLLVGVMIAGCATDSLPTGPIIDSTDDLVAALRKAGAEVQETAIPAMLPGLPGGRAYFVGEARIDMFEFESDIARREALDELLRLGGNPPHLWSGGRLLVAYDGTDGATIALISGLMGDVVNLPENAAVEPYPPAVPAAIGWASEMWGVDPGAITVITYETAEWPDSCLGLPEAGEMCATVLTPGWKIELQVGSESITLRTDELGTVVRAEP